MPRDLSIVQLMLYLAELGESPLKILGPYFTVNKHQVYSYFTVWFRSFRYSSQIFHPSTLWYIVYEIIQYQ